MDIIGAGLVAVGAYLLYTWLDGRRRMIEQGVWHEQSWTEAYLELAVSAMMILAGLALAITQ